MLICLHKSTRKGLYMCTSFYMIVRLYITLVSFMFKCAEDIPS